MLYEFLDGFRKYGMTESEIAAMFGITTVVLRYVRYFAKITIS